MVQIVSLFLLAGLVASSVSTPFKRTVAQVEADIASIVSSTTSLENAIQGFPASGLVGALGIHTSATGLNSQITAATTDVKNTGAVTEADAGTILNSVKAFEPTIIQALTNIVSKKAAFQALPLGGIPALVLSDLQALSASTAAFEKALVAAAPVSSQL
ncbi:hypothetical protein C0991_011034 [Blastosporella zonata]|nr:hypothetical protein C0991_011034 [Blastosporella zonata]